MENELNIFLLIGQSNMAGRGRLNEVAPLSNPQIFMFRDGHWTAATEPLHTDKPHVAGIGLSMSFAVTLMKEASISPIGLVPCAVGGTPLSRWMPGADLYENAVKTIRAALSKGKLSGVLWHQGEGDSGNYDDAASYGERLGKMIKSLRSDLSVEEIPVIAGQLGYFLRNRKNYVFSELINQQLRELDGKLSAYSWISARDLTDNGDKLHFNAKSLREFGNRYAKGYLDLTKNTR